MTKRSYNQYCGLAVALDLLGERWSMLVLRNLLIGPKRFKDLLDGLPGIGTGLLSQRLKQLEAAGLITRTTLAPPAGSTVYQLTPAGDALRPALLELIRWGLTQLGEPTPEQHLEAEPLALAMEARFDPAAADGADGVHELRVDSHVFRIAISHGTIEIRAAVAEAPRTSISTDIATLIALTNGSRTLADTLGDQSLTVSGDLAATLVLAQAFGIS